MSRKPGVERRAQLLEVAAGLFSANGFEGTSTRAIAEAAGVNEALIFHYFPTKLALFRAVIVECGIQSLQRTSEFDTHSESTLRELLTARFTNSMDAMWKNRVAIRMLVRAALSDSVASDDLKAIDAQALDWLSRQFKDYEASGAIKAGTADSAASIVFFALRGFFFVEVRSNPEDWDEARKRFIDDFVTVMVAALQP